MTEMPKIWWSDTQGLIIAADDGTYWRTGWVAMLQDPIQLPADAAVLEIAWCEVTHEHPYTSMGMTWNTECTCMKRESHVEHVCMHDVRWLVEEETSRD